MQEDTRQYQDERVPYKAKAATPNDFFSSFLAKLDVTNNTISSSQEPTSRKILEMNTLDVSIPRINFASGGLSGLNSCTSILQISESWWMKSVGSSKITPAVLQVLQQTSYGIRSEQE